MTAFVVVELPTIRSVMLANVATRDEKKPLVLVLFVALRLVMKAFVVVEFPTIKLVMLAKVATREAKKPLVLVLLVEKRLVAVRAEAEAVLRVV